MVEKKKRRRGSRKPKTGIYESTKTGQVCSYRSGWEQLFLEYLDNDPDVTFWSYEPFTISYVSNKKTGRIRKYIPDVEVHRVDGKKYLVEIKPSNRLDGRLVKKKIEEGKKYAEEHEMEFLIVTEVELKALGLL